MNMFYEEPKIGQQLLDVPMGRMIRDMAFAIAEAQMRLDENSMEVAEMMGGLKSIKTTVGGEEFITFKDSRVFFGQERMMMSQAVELYNNTNDISYRASIAAKLSNTAVEDAYELNGEIIEVVEVDGDPNTAATTFTPDKKEDQNVFYFIPGTPDIWYTYDSESSIYSEIINDDEKPTVSSTTKVFKTVAVDTEVMIPQRLSMMELGFTPTFYQFVDTIIEVKISIKYTREGSHSVSVSNTSRRREGSASFGFRRGIKASSGLTTSQVNASYSQKYSYSAEGSSLLRTKLVPIPPPSILEERIQQQMEIARFRTGSTAGSQV